MKSCGRCNAPVVPRGHRYCRMCTEELMAHFDPRKGNAVLAFGYQWPVLVVVRRDGDTVWARNPETDSVYTLNRHNLTPVI